VRSRQPSQFKLEALEQRILLSADSLLGALAGGSDAPGPMQPTLPEAMEVVLLDDELAGLQDSGLDAEASGSGISNPDDLFAGLTTEVLPNSEPSSQTLSNDEEGQFQAR
jgi:hypothetical protein